MYPFDIYLKYQKEIEEASKRFNLSQARISAKIFRESSGDPKALRSEPQIDDASYGLMQILWSTAQFVMRISEVPRIEKPEDLFDPRVNILYGCAYFRYLLDFYLCQDIGAINCAEADYNSGRARFASSTGNLSVDRHITEINKRTDFLIHDPRYRKLHNLDKEMT